jgi:SWI/SNF-related matrix-associated actin-dependent regulator of chromatin subfamily A3
VVSRAACYLEAERRICLSGTPIQNKLDDIWALFKFLRLAPFDQRETWTKHVLDYAKAGNSLGVVRLQTILKHCTLRRTKDTTNDDGSKILDLPPRKEVIVTLELGEEERKVYDHHFQQGQRSFRESDDAGKVDVVNILQHILRLRQICDHPTLLESSSAEDLEEEIMADGFMDVDTAKASIERDGLNLRRALAYVGSIKAEEGACCASCQQVFNIADIVKEDPEADEMPAKGKGKKAKNKVNYPILLRCCHLYCKPLVQLHIARYTDHQSAFRSELLQGTHLPRLA